MLFDMNFFVFFLVIVIVESFGVERVGERFFFRVEFYVRFDVVGLREFFVVEFIVRFVFFVRGDVLYGVFSVRFCY